jgi:hypothetical protein
MEAEMVKLCRALGTILLVLFFISPFSLGASVSGQESSLSPQRGNKNVPIKLVIWTDHAKYSLQDSMNLSASLQNTGGKPIYLDRRMFWTGLGGGLALEIRDANGKIIPARILSDAIMPPPKEGDTSVLIRLDEGFFYGTSVNLIVKDFFPAPGKYSLRVVYKSWLRKESVQEQFRNLPVLWVDSPEIPSELLLIEVTK